MMTVRRYTTGLGRTAFTLADGVVWVTTKTHSVGGWRVERYGSRLGIEWVRAWATENLTDPAVTA